MSVMLRKYVKTTEDWYPTFEPYANPSNANYANPRRYPCFRVDLIRLGVDAPHEYRVLCSGGDDFGLEKDFKDLFEASRNYDGITQYTTQAILLRRGYQHA